MPSRVRFGVFELNLNTRELRSQDETLVLQEQPYKVLLLLIERGDDVVTRDDIRETLWPGDQSVNIELRINAAVKNLRNALKDSGNEPVYIQTLRNQGYRLLVPAHYIDTASPENYAALAPTGTDGVDIRLKPGPQAVPDTPSENEPIRSSEERRIYVRPAQAGLPWRTVTVILTMVVIVAGVAYYRRLYRAKPLTDKDTIVLSAFTNRTGDPVFDDTLKQGLAVQLDQSPFLQQVSDSKLNATLKLMGRPVTDRLTGETTRDVCMRVGGTAMVTGSIDPLGNQYVIGLKALNCSTGEVLGETQEQAGGKVEVLKALDAAAIALRRKLGESLNSLQKHATPVEEATTPSLEALKAYSLAGKEKFAQGDGASLAFYDRAIELDPSFAIAYYGRSAAYRNLNQLDRARADERKAYDLRLGVSDRERFSIEAAYYLIWTGELEKAAQTYELWQQTYPREYVPHTNLGFIYVALGKLDKALEQAREAMRLQPNDGASYGNLGGGYQNLNRLDEAEAVYKQAAERKIEGPYLLVNLYTLAFLKGDVPTMAQTAMAAAGRPGVEDLLLAAKADTEAWHGRFKNAYGLTRQAMDSAVRNEAKETAAAYQALAALREIAAGDRTQGVADARGAIKLAPNRDVRAMAALAMAEGGDVAGAAKLEAELNKDFPLDTLVQRYWLPSVRAAQALSRNDAKAAIAELATASDLDFSEPAGVTVYLVPPYLRGQAYLRLREGGAARGEFQKFIDHYGMVGNFPWGALSRLGVARAYAAEGNTNEAQAAYREFVGFWSNADPDVPVYKQAKAELAALR
ncbi:MAG TPA: winged helix-turn-helix domain-containing protein [Candidatus Polarisedimenticolia bacterium]|nr:winged helix-turn-helix domain-containing protein [Candidatus Polarisedimenticolia bacterium]